MEPLQNKNAKTVGRATKRAARELTGDDGNFVVTTDLGNKFATLDRELRRPCTGRSGRGPGHPDAEEGPGHKGGAQGRAVERPLQAGGRGLQRAAPRDGARRARGRGEAAGHGVQGPARQRRQVPAQQGPHRPAREGASMHRYLDPHMRSGHSSAVASVIKLVDLWPSRNRYSLGLFPRDPRSVILDRPVIS